MKHVSQKLEMIIIEAFRHQDAHTWNKRRDVLDKIDELIGDQYKHCVACRDYEEDCICP